MNTEEQKTDLVAEGNKVMKEVLEEEMFSWNFTADPEQEAIKGHEEMCEKYK